MNIGAKIGDRVTLKVGALQGKSGFIKDSRKSSKDELIHFIVLDDDYCAWYKEHEFIPEIKVVKTSHVSLDEDGLIDYINSITTGPNYGSYFE